MSEQDLKFIKNWSASASLDYNVICGYYDTISKIIENGEAHKKIEDFTSPDYLHSFRETFIDPQFDKKLGIVPIPKKRPYELQKFSIPLLKKAQIELWKVLQGAFVDEKNQAEFQVLDAIRKNGVTIGTVDDDLPDEYEIYYPYQYRESTTSNFIKFVMGKESQIGDEVYLRFDTGRRQTVFNYKNYCDYFNESHCINFKSYELYHEYLLYAMSDCKATPAQLSIYSSNGINILNDYYSEEEKRLTMDFVLKLPSFIVNYEELIKIDQDRIKKQRAKKSSINKRCNIYNLPDLALVKRK